MLRKGGIMVLIIAGISLFLISIFVRYAWVVVPAATYGMRNVLGRRVGVWYQKDALALDEGPHLIIPWAEKIELFPYKTETISIPMMVTTQDGMKVSLHVNVDVAPDRRFVVRVYSQKSESAITKGLQGALETDVVEIAGKKDGLYFVHHIEALVRLINCKLRLSTPPHLEPSSILSRCEKSVIAPEERIEFYDKYGKEIDALLRKEKGIVNEFSDVEKEYGIDISNVTMHAPEFTTEMVRALEEKRKSEEVNKGVEEKFKKKLQMVESLKGTGVSPEKALDDANISLGQAEQKVNTLQVQGIDVGNIAKIILKGGRYAQK